MAYRRDKYWRSGLPGGRTFVQRDLVSGDVPVWNATEQRWEYSSISESVVIGGFLNFDPFAITTDANGFVLERLGQVAGSVYLTVDASSDSGIRARLTNSTGGVQLAMNTSAGTPSSGMRLLQLAADFTEEDNWITGARDGEVTLYYNGTATIRTEDPEGADEFTGAEVLHSDGNFYPVMIGVWPSPDVSVDRTMTKDDCGYHLRLASAARVYTTLGSSDTTYPIGGMTMLSCGAASGGSTIVAGSGITLSWLTGAAVTNGSPRTLATGSVVWLFRRSASVFVLWGFGIT